MREEVFDLNSDKLKLLISYSDVSIQSLQHCVRLQ